MLYVDKQFHRKGIARELINRGLDHIRSNSPVAKQVTVNSSTYARAFYENMGFRKTEEEKTIHGILHVPMSLILSEKKGGILLKTPLHKKTTTEDIKERFDRDVERFSDLNTGQEAVIDAPLMLELISETAVKLKPDAENMLDIGCGAGNNSISIVRRVPGINCDLVDLSLPMLDRAKERLSEENGGEIRNYHGDFRDVPLPRSHYDLIVSGHGFTPPAGRRRLGSLLP